MTPWSVPKVDFPVLNVDIFDLGMDFGELEMDFFEKKAVMVELKMDFAGCEVAIVDREMDFARVEPAFVELEAELVAHEGDVGGVQAAFAELGTERPRLDAPATGTYSLEEAVTTKPISQPAPERSRVSKDEAPCLIAGEPTLSNADARAKQRTRARPT